MTKLLGLLSCGVALTLAAATADAADQPKPAPKNWCGPSLAADENVQIALPGVFSKRLEPGPPVSREPARSDDQHTAWFVTLDYRTPVLINGKTVVFGLLQIKGLDANFDEYNRFVGRHVMAEGKLWAGAGEGDVTAAVMTESDVRVIGDVDCKGDAIPKKR